MKSFIIAFAAALTLAWAAPARAGETKKTAEGDIETYDPVWPPALVIEELYPQDIDTKAFILVEGALLVPDVIHLTEDNDFYSIEIVNEDELDRFEPVAELRFPNTCSLDAENLGKLIRFEQRMWRKGLRVASREYETVGGHKVRYTAFRVTFEQCGDLYRATLTLYKAKSTLGDQFDAAAKRLGDILDELGRVRQEIERARRAAGTKLDELKKTLGTVTKDMQQLGKDLADLEKAVKALDRRVSSLERD